jgi:hypothetical protein
MTCYKKTQTNTIITESEGSTVKKNVKTSLLQAVDAPRVARG